VRHPVPVLWINRLKMQTMVMGSTINRRQADDSYNHLDRL